ncbi:MAG TPA: hypothetical protein PK819_10210, partial [Thermomicrobiales bacterium]|nr:hypothetical protein [Thermomicrobiales bacterium]
HITLPWPRVDSEVDVLQDVAALKLHEYRPNPPAPDPVELLGEIASTASGLTTYGFPHTRPVDWSSVRAQLQAHPRWPLLAQLVARPGEIVDAETLMEGSNLARHREVPLAFAELAEILVAENLPRPWQEGPRGWWIEPDVADALR